MFWPSANSGSGMTNPTSSKPISRRPISLFCTSIDREQSSLAEQRRRAAALRSSAAANSRPVRTRLSPASFELQLVGLQVSRVLIKVASVYRPPNSSKATFIDEFTDLLATVGQGCNERLVICVDFNVPGDKLGTINERLSTLLNVYGYQQHVEQPTRGHNLLDLLITPKPERIAAAGHQCRSCQFSQSVRPQPRCLRLVGTTAQTRCCLVSIPRY